MLSLPTFSQIRTSSANTTCLTACWQTSYKTWHLLRVYLKQDIVGTEHNLKGDLLTTLQELTTLVRQEHAKVALRARQVRIIMQFSVSLWNLEIDSRSPKHTKERPRPLVENLIVWPWLQTSNPTYVVSKYITIWPAHIKHLKFVKGNWFINRPFSRRLDDHESVVLSRGWSWYS